LPRGIPRYLVIALARAGWALPVNTFSSSIGYLLLSVFTLPHYYYSTILQKGETWMGVY
jgi:hypothetical protein